jgi:adenosylcobinamide-GDP ribazoletransferase
MTIGKAFKFLTLADNAQEFDAGPAGIGILCLPLVGLLLGFVLVVVNRAIESYLASEVLAVVLLTILIIATGGWHLVGLQKTFSASRRENSAANSAERWALYGVLAVLLVLLFKSHSIEVIGESRTLSVLLTPLLARWSVVLFLFGSTPLAVDAGARIVESVRSWHVIAASVATLGFALFIGSTQALWVALSLSLLALFARSYVHHRQGGVSLAHCGALIEVGEALSLTLFASL